MGELDNHNPINHADTAGLRKQGHFQHFLGNRHSPLGLSVAKNGGIAQIVAYVGLGDGIVGGRETAPQAGGTVVEALPFYIQRGFGGGTHKNDGSFSQNIAVGLLHLIDDAGEHRQGLLAFQLFFR